MWRRIAGARHGDPFSVLGPHVIGGRHGWCGPYVPARRAILQVLARKAERLARLERRNWRFLRGLSAGVAQPRSSYRLRATHPAAPGSSPTLTPSARCSGRWTTICSSRARIGSSIDRLGAHPINHEGVDGVHFAVWAPQRHARLRGRRLQRLGRARCIRCASASTAACGRSSSPSSAPARSTNIEIVGRRRRTPAAEGRSVRLRGRMRPSTASVVAEHLAISTGPTRPIWRARRGRPAAHADGDLRGASRLLAARRRRALPHLRRTRRDSSSPMSPISASPISS